MNKIIHSLAEIKLVGMMARTSNALEMNPDTAKIGFTMQKFFSSGMQAHISGRKNPGRIFAVYTHYESDEHGPYTYFLGEEVSDFDNVREGFETLTVPAQSYIKFTSEPGPMPAVCIHMWKKIWTMTAAELGGKRAYGADFEIYDERSQDPQNAVLDIYIGIRK
jgi:predicted transcriptional regulator YdeE